MMNRALWNRTLAWSLALLLTAQPCFAGRGGGGFRAGGGGMARPAGGGMARPGGGMPMSRPAPANMGRPAGGGMPMARPSGPAMQRPGGGFNPGAMNRPAMPTNRPAPGSLPSINRPSGGGGFNRPGGGLPGGGQVNRPANINPNRPGLGGGNRPTTLPGNLGQPGLGGQPNRPGLGGQGNRPGLGGQPNRPGLGGVGNRPTTLPGNVNQPGLGGQGNRPGLGGQPNRPGLGGQPNRPGLGGQGNRPGLTDANTRPNFGNGNRPTTLPGGLGNLPNGGNQGLNRPSRLPGLNTRPGTGNWGNAGIGNNAGNNWGSGNWGNGNWGNGSHWGNSGHWNSNHWGNNNFTNNNININQNNWGYGGWGGGWGGGGYWGGWGYNNWGWNNHPWGAWAATTAAVGLTSWALGSSFYNCGYASYSNPYYVPTQYVVVSSPAVDYSAPIATQSYAQQPANTTIIVNNDGSQSTKTTDPAAQPGQASPAPTAASSAEDEAATLYGTAADAFKTGDYNTALKQAETALTKMPGNTTLHQFRALCLFAMGKYPDAAGTLFATLSVEPGWDWTALSSFYPSVAVYTEQLRKLEAYTKANPKAADGHFVLGYHYLCGGHSDAALKQYKEVAALQPQDQLSAQMVRMLSPEGTAAPGGADPKTAPQPNPAAPAAQPAAPAGKPPATIVGTWKAPGTGGGEIELGIKEDGTFDWKFTNQGKSNEFSGKYEINQDMLVLENSQGQTMIARVTDAGANKFKFEMMGGPPNDPGLTFSK